MKNALLTIGLFSVVALLTGFSTAEKQNNFDNTTSIAAVEFDITTATTPSEIGGQQVPKDRLPF